MYLKFHVTLHLQANKRLYFGVKFVQRGLQIPSSGGPDRHGATIRSACMIGAEERWWMPSTGGVVAISRSRICSEYKTSRVRQMALTVSSHWSALQAFRLSVAGRAEWFLAGDLGRGNEIPEVIG